MNQWMRAVDGELVNLRHVRRIRVDTWAGDDYGVAKVPLHSVIAEIQSGKDWGTLARGFASKTEAQTWIDTNLGWLVGDDDRT